MKSNLLISFALSTFILAFSVLSAFGQGSTTAGMNGVVLDENGEGLPGATVLAVHQPTGSEYGTVTNTAGRFTLANMNVGGPYQVTVSFIGYETFGEGNIFLQLGQRYQLNAQLRDQTTELAEIEILASQYDVIDGNRTGAQTVVSTEQIESQPTVTRSIGDFVRLTPQARIDEGGDGYSISIAGVNNRLNAIYIDGAVNNDVFGLAGSGTNGGQSGVSPISIDAFEQFQVSVAPFDVRQSGFAGGAINAVTRSGSNEFEGSAYYFWQNENLAGDIPGPIDEGEEREPLAPFTARQYGFRLGGPLVKNKLFFFVNTELQRDETPQPFLFSRYQGDATEADLNQLEGVLRNQFGYDPGPFNDNAAFLESEKVLVRLDWNINRNHKMTLRHSYVNAENLEAVQSGPQSIQYLNSSEFFPSRTNSSALELKSNFSANTSNSLIVGYTRVRDDRDPFGQDFPFVEIDDGDGNIEFGSEQFSTANQLDQDIITITDNFEWYKGRHTITFGTHNEFYSVYNLFIRQNYGYYQYDSLQQFLLDVQEPNSDFGATQYDRSYSLVDDITGDGSAAAAEFGGMQLGFYVQDEFQVTNNLRLTGGLRIDIPIFTDDTPTNTTFNNDVIPDIEALGYDLQGAQTGTFVDPQLMFAPRLGFNWDVGGKGTTQVRGGVGIFNSRSPLVWPGGAYNNNGATVGGDRVFRFDRDGNLANVIKFNPDAFDQPRNVAPGSGEQSGQIDLFAKDFRFPQVGKINLAIDQQLPGGIFATVEGLYTGFINNIYYQNFNIRPSTEQAEGADDRLLYNRFNPVNGDYTGIYLASNTDKGYTYNVTAQIQKPFRSGLNFSLAYSYTDAQTIYDGTSSQNSSQWRGLNTVNGRNIFNDIARSDFASGSRVIGSVSFRKEYLGFMGTQITLFYEGQSGEPYSYIIGHQDNYTNEDSRERSLFYVPANQSDLLFGELVENADGDEELLIYPEAEQQSTYQELSGFIDSDEYLSGRRGDYTERNQSRVPWSNIFDLKILQDFYVEVGEGKRNTIQLSLDIFNVGNMLNPEWGLIYDAPSFGQYELVQFEGFQDGTTRPVFSFNGVDDNEPWQGSLRDSGLRSSRWRMQLGVRYIFGN
ncbi:MAG: carboxypeptidase regulatory-like domain-containing protein [Cyclobacteriaceae bacterium]